MRGKAIRLAAALLIAVPLACVAAIPAGALELEKSFEAVFKNYSGDWAGGTLSPIKMQLKEDTLTLDYSPVFCFDKSFSLTDREKAAIIDECVAGFKHWAGVYPLYGRELTVKVDVHPDATNSRLSANVMVLPYNALGTMVPGCLLWRPYSPFLTMYLRTNSPQYMNFERSAMHEFGHVLGLFDAYGYGAQHWRVLGLDFSWLGEWLLPEAPQDRAPYNTVMRSGWEITPTEMAMLLYAWKNGRLQLYTESMLTWLGAEVSQAFFD